MNDKVKNSAPNTRNIPKHNTQRRINQSIKRDVVNAHDYITFEHRWSCDECTHFNSVSETCTLGYETSHHRLAEQRRSFELSGRIAFCRFHEID